VLAARVASLSIVEDLDVAEHGVGQLKPGPPPLSIEQLNPHAWPFASTYIREISLSEALRSEAASLQATGEKFLITPHESWREDLFVLSRCA